MDEQKRPGMLNRISDTIVQKNRLFFWAFLALLIFSVLSFGWVHIEISFTDVAESDYFYDPVRWAVSNGITDGTSDTTFSPKDPCTRGQVVTFLWAAAEKPAPVKTATDFTDVAESEYYCDPVLWASENEITDGATDTLFGAKDTCTRAQVMTFLWKAMGM